MKKATEFQDEITERVGFFADVTQVSSRGKHPANDSGVAYLHAYDVYALHHEQRRNMQRRAHLVRALIMSIPECEWPSKTGVR